MPSEPNRLHFVIEGPPRPKGRPRMGANGNVYTPDATRAYELSVRMYALQAVRASGWKLSNPTARFAVWLHAYFASSRRIDLDNVLKCADGANGIIWKDDSQIDEVHAYRRIDKDNPRLEVTVEVMT